MVVRHRRVQHPMTPEERAATVKVTRFSHPPCDQRRRTNPSRVVRRRRVPARKVTVGALVE